jgi:4-oxalocrotonate tautomerase
LDDAMPLIQVHMLRGRTDQQKRQIVEAMTKVMTDVCGSSPERVTVLLHEMDADNWGRGGAVMADELGTAHRSVRQ